MTGGLAVLLWVSFLLNVVLLSWKLKEQSSDLALSVNNEITFSRMIKDGGPCSTKSSNAARSSIRTGNSSTVHWDIVADMENCTATTVPSDLFVPIFILTRDRVQSLQEALDSYERTLSSPHEIVILDHNSDYPPMLKFLQSLRDERRITVHTLHEPVWDDALAHADRIMQQYLQERRDVEYYVMTDPDVALERTHSDILLFLAALLKSCPRVNVVGPHLQISDIPDHYQGRYRGNSVYEWESQFWRTVPFIATWRGAGYHFAEQLIDTTFAMRRRSQRFARITCPCLRTYAPYAAVHLDWYTNTTDLPPDKRYYLNRAHGGVNNW